MNNVILSGRVANNIELNYTQSGMAVCRFGLALNRGKDKEGNDKGADFPNCVVFGKSAEAVAKYSAKGLRLAVAGRLQTGNYKDKNDVTHYTTDVIVERFEIIDWNYKESNATSERKPDPTPATIGGYEPPEGFAIADVDVPF